MRDLFSSITRPRIENPSKLIKKPHFIGISSSISQVRGDDRILGNDNPFNFKTDLEDDFVSVFDSIEIMGPETYTQENSTGIDRLGNNRDTIDESDNFTDNTI